MTTPPSAKEKIIVALDLPDARGALRRVEQLDGAVFSCKVGHLAIGRPITAQPDPRAAADEISREISDPT